MYEGRIARVHMLQSQVRPIRLCRPSRSSARDTPLAARRKVPEWDTRLRRPGATNGDEPLELAEAPLVGRIRTGNASRPTMHPRPHATTAGL